MIGLVRGLIRLLFPPSRQYLSPATSGPAGEDELFRLTPVDTVTWRDAFEGCAIFGAIGAGKTSGSGALILSSMIARGAGGFIACTKPDEAESVLATCRKLGREGDVIHVTPGGRHFFNWLEYDLRRGGKGAGIPANMAETLSTFTSFVRPEQTLHEGENTHFFKENANRLFIQSLKLIQLAGVTATLDLIADIVTSAPKCQDDAEGPRFKQTAIAVLLQMARESGGDKEEIKGADRFWTKEVYQGSDRALGDIALTLATSLFRLRENPVRDLIACKDGCSFVPEMAEAGAIILLEAPAMEYQSTGRLITRMHKFLFQEAMKRRRVRPDLRPVFIYCDEAQSYLVPTDSDFQQVCRESKVATIYLSQSISNYEAVLGNRERAEQLLSSLTLKIYHANSGPTNEWASRQIADAWQQMTSHTYGERGSRESNSISINKQRNAQVLPGDFTRLRTGGVEASRCVDAIVFKAGRTFRLTGGPFVRTTFYQGV